MTSRTLQRTHLYNTQVQRNIVTGSRLRRPLIRNDVKTETSDVGKMARQRP